MAEATQTIHMKVTLDKLWATIVKYENYPQFIDTVSSTEVLSRESGKSVVRYGIKLLGKEISYTLVHVEQAPRNMSWSLIESNLLKENKGAWELKDLEQGTVAATYKLTLDFKIYVPGFILNSLVKASLPKMLSQFESEARRS